MPGEITLDSRCESLTAGLLLKVRISADMVGIGVGIVDGRQMPAVGIQNLPDLPSRVLVAAAVDEADIISLQPHQADLGRAPDITALLCDPHQFVHTCSPFPCRPQPFSLF